MLGFPVELDPKPGMDDHLFIFLRSAADCCCRRASFLGGWGLVTSRLRRYDADGDDSSSSMAFPDQGDDELLVEEPVVFGVW